MGEHNPTWEEMRKNRDKVAEPINGRMNSKANLRLGKDEWIERILLIARNHMGVKKGRQLEGHRLGLEHS